MEAKHRRGRDEASCRARDGAGTEISAAGRFPGTPDSTVAPKSVLRRITRWVLLVVSVPLLIVAIQRILAPQYAGALAALNSLESVSPLLVMVSVGLELTSLGAYSLLTASVLGPGHPGYFTLLRIDLVALGVNHVVPGGGGTSAAVRFRLLQRAGVHPEEALTAAAIETVGSNLVLVPMFVVGLVLSLATISANNDYRTALFGALGAICTTALAVWFLTRKSDLAIAMARSAARHLPMLSEDAAESFLRTMINQVQLLAQSPRRMGIDLVLAVVYWSLDATALWVLLVAFGHNFGVGPLLSVYCVGNILALLPLTPGGLGIVEGVMVPAFGGFGAPAVVALLGVLGWRVVQFWMPMPLGILSYVSLAFGAFRKHVVSGNGGQARRPPVNASGQPHVPGVVDPTHRQRDVRSP